MKREREKESISKGKGEKEAGFVDSIDEEVFQAQVGVKPAHLRSGQKVIGIDPFYFRPTEVDVLCGDSAKAREKLGWIPRFTIDMLIEDMLKSDLKLMKKDRYLRDGGFDVLTQIEDVQ